MHSDIRILVFSPNSDFNKNISRILAKAKYNIINTSAEDACIAEFKRYPPHVSIIDSDIKLCSKLKTENETDSVFILADTSEKKFNLKEIEKSHADSYIEYPFSDNTLIITISSLLKELKLRENFKNITTSIKESEEKYKRLFQLSPDGIGYYVGGKIGFLNEAGIQIFGGKSIDEIFGKYFLDFVHPYDKEFVFDKIKNKSLGKHLYFVARIITLDGRTKYIDVATTPFLLGGVNAVQFIFRDITEKKLNELNFIESKKRLEFVQKIAKLGYWEMDIGSSNLTWSKDIYELLGLSITDFQPTMQNFLNIIHIEDREVFQKAINTSLSGIFPPNIEYRVINGKGEIIFVNQKCIISYDEKGYLSKLIGSVQDITDRKQMENALRESQSKLSGIINSAMDAIITVDVDQNILLFNSTAEKMFLYSAKEAIGQPLEKFIPVRFREIYKKHIENFETGLIRSIGGLDNINGLRKNGEEFPIEVSMSQVEVSGHKLFTAIIRDITEKKLAEDAIINSEARYRLLFKKNPLPMWVYDLENYHFTAVNSAAIKSYGYTKNEFLSMTIFDIRPPEEIPALKDYISKRRDEYQYAGVWKHKKKNGTIIDAEVVSHEIEFDGRPSRIVLANDVTDKKKAEDELRFSREQLRSLASHLQNIREEERSAIAREIHDELGQVLTSLKMNLTFIDKKLIGDEAIINIENLHKEIDSMKSVIDHSVKRVRKIITELRPEVLDELGLISALEWQALEFKTKSGIDCELLNSFGELEVGKNISIAVYRICQEALTNVIRHSKATKVNLKIGRLNNHLELVIVDNGIGIDTEKINRAKTFGVLGMRERVTILGGSFEVEKIKPSGTKISVNIPLDVNQN